jgi:hypothetical protein
VYEHEQFGALFMLPPFPKRDRVLDYHLLAVQTLLDGFGIADPTTFAAELSEVRLRMRSKAVSPKIRNKRGRDET